MTVVAAFLVKLFLDGTEDPDRGQILFVVAFGLWIIPTSWAYYFKERKAARLRKGLERHLNLLRAARESRTGSNAEP